MFKEQSGIKISAGVLHAFLGFLLVLAFSGGMPAQESLQVSKDNLSDGITVTVQGNEIAAANNFLVLSDSSKNALSIRQISLNGTPLWMKKSSEPVDVPNVIHWSEDDDSGMLAIDLSGVRDRLTAQSQLELLIVPFVTKMPYFRITISQANTLSNLPTDNLQKIKDINIDLNIEE
jgi:hypothetical protein